MKWVIVFILILSGKQTLACNLTSPLRHINPDKSVGGLVSSMAKVEPTAFIGYNAKVCDQAWVDGNAIVLDFAIIKENAWVRSYTKIRNFSIIAGDSYLQGNFNDEVVIAERSNISGTAKILQGTNISGDSKISAGPVIKNSSIFGKAVICESHNLNDVEVGDDYFCSNQVYSDDEIRLSSYRVDQTNLRSEILQASLLKTKFSLDKRVFKILINDTEIEEEKFEISSNKIIIDTDDYQRNGWNEIIITGRDQYGKKVALTDRQYLLGDIQKIIQVESLIENEDFKVEIEFENELHKIKGIAAYQQGSIVLEGLTEELDNYKVKIIGVSSNSLIDETFSSYSELPEIIQSYNFSNFIENDMSIENLDSWKISHPSNVSIKSSNGKNYIEIDSPDNRFEMSKRFKTSNTQHSLKVGFDLPDVSSLLSENSEIVIKLVDFKNKKIESYTYGLGVNEELSKSITKSNIRDSEIGFYLRLEPSLRVKNSFSPLIIRSTIFPEIAVTFNPFHLNAFNAKESNKPITKYDNYSCEDKAFSIGPTSNTQGSIDKNFNFLSVGYVGDMFGDVKFNRIWGTLKISGVYKENIDVDKIKLIGVQDGNIKFELPLARCAKELFGKMNAYSEVNFPENLNLVGYLFELPLDNLFNLNLNDGSKISLFVKVKINGRFQFIDFSNEVSLTLLANPLVPKAKWYSLVDHYDSPTKSILRTGGDKWILPGYSNYLSNVLSKNSTWLINDMSKSNGGDFRGHLAHKDGNDVDLRFKENEVIFNFSAYPQFANPTEAWKKALSKIESFILNTDNEYHVIDKYFLTREQKEVGKSPGTWSQKINKRAVMSKLEYRCVGNSKKRYIDMTSKEERSLIQHFEDHYDHLHLRFNKDNDYKVKVIEPTPPSEVVLSDLWFEFNNQGLLKVYPKNSSSFNGLKVLWRLQQSGFDEPFQYVQFGKWFKNSITFDESSDKINKTILDTIYLTVADINTGGCLGWTLKIDMNLEKKSRWSY